MKSLGFANHDHVACIETGVAAAAAHCAERGLQLTPVRKRVLEILLKEHRAMGAYDILDVLRGEGFNSQPPVAYRALDFLVGQGFVHRVEGLNAFVACSHPGVQHDAAFLICRGCRTVAETEIPVSALNAASKQAGFNMEGATVEVQGRCSDCTEDGI